MPSITTLPINAITERIDIVLEYRTQSPEDNDDKDQLENRVTDY